jgi:hypothetical protein
MKCFTYLGRAFVLMLLSAPMARPCAAQAQTNPDDATTPSFDGQNLPSLFTSADRPAFVEVDGLVDARTETNVLQLSDIRPNLGEDGRATPVARPALAFRETNQLVAATSWSPRRSAPATVITVEPTLGSTAPGTTTSILPAPSLSGAANTDQYLGTGFLGPGDSVLHSRKRRLEDAKRRRRTATLEAQNRRQCIEHGLIGCDCGPTFESALPSGRLSADGGAPGSISFQH